MTYRIAIITADSLRHKYFYTKFFVAKGLQLVSCYSEKTKASKESEYADFGDIKKVHFSERARVEKDFFEDYVNSNFNDSKWISISRGEVNTDKIINHIKDLELDFIVCYGCSIISKDFIDNVNATVLNVHLGLSPYYLGSGTNFHPLAAGKPELCGYTLMYMNEGIDTGEIIHQGRSELNVFDNSHHYGCKIIKKMTTDYIKLIVNFSKVRKLKQPSFENSVFCFRKDSSRLVVKRMYNNLKENMFQEYLSNKDSRNKKYPILKQRFLK